jgi:pimeloyl-ACP methyl ester carboxylesterase
MLVPLALQILYRAPALPVSSPPPAPLKEVWLDLGAGGRAMAWTTSDSIPPGAPIAILFHGNSDNLETLRRAGLCMKVERLGATFLAVDYPGYGRSPGDPSEASLLATGSAAVAWARRHHPGRPVILLGWSLGAAVAIATAARHAGEVDGLIALSPWTRLLDIVQGFLPELPEFAQHRYDSLAAARRVEVPALVIHGEQDQVIPVDQGKAIVSALRGPTRFVPIRTARHHDLLANDETWRELARFFNERRAKD